jgi:class 3 adenylate cyclase
MIAVVLVATGIGLLASTAQVRAAYRDALQDLFQSAANTVVQVRDARLAAVQARCRRLVNSPRVFAAMQSGDPEVLAQVADDELREFFQRAQENAVGGRASAGYLFLDAQGQAIEPGSGTPAIDRAVVAGWASVREPSMQDMAPRVVYVAVEEQPLEVLLTPVPDPDDGSCMGALAVLFDFATPAPMPVTGGGEIRSGLMLGGALFGGQIPVAAAESLQAADTVGGERQIWIDGTPWLALERPIDATDRSARLVLAASLEPLHAAVRRLVLSGLGAGLAGVVLGLMVSVWMGRGLARPVAVLSEAARQVGQGDYSVQVAVTRSDELGQLSDRFNQMAQGLALRDRYRGLLDLVADPGIAREMIGGADALGGSTLPAAVIFCDIRGFTPLANRLSPGELVVVLNEHMTALTEVVYRHGGVVDKFVGDLVMAVFGAPRGGVNDAERAARCALDMVRERARRNRTAVHPIEIGVGVAFGPMVAGCMGSARRLNYTVLGDRVNLAARLCSAAPAGSVYVDEAVRGQLGPGWRVSPLEPLQVKGFDRPVEAFRLDDREEVP